MNKQKEIAKVENNDGIKYHFERPARNFTKKQRIWILVGTNLLAILAIVAVVLVSIFLG